MQESGLVLIPGEMNKTIENRKRKKFPGRFHLQPYKGAEKSGVIAYEIGDDFIILKFKEQSNDGRQIYFYNYTKPGEEHVEAMKKKAMEGKGLSGYRSQHVAKEEYAAYWDESVNRFITNS